jgi:hypothetical protein
MIKKYNIIGQKDTKNTVLLDKILSLKEAGATFVEISLAVKRSQKRVKELYYKDRDKKEQARLDRI